MAVANIEIAARVKATGRGARARRVFVRLVLAAIVIVGLVKLWELRRYRRAMNDVKQEMRAGRHGHAVRKLTSLLNWKPDADEATYLLGVCERARGQDDAAMRAWEQVAPGSSSGAPAIQGRMELLMKHGRLADAETMITQAMSNPRSDRAQARPFSRLALFTPGSRP